MPYQRSSAFIPGGITTGSAYVALDAMGNVFPISGVGGQRGGVLRNVQLFDRASGKGSYRLHLYSDEPSALVNGVAFAIAIADESKYLGYVDFAGWVSAAAAKLVSVAKAPDVDVYAVSGRRVIYGQMQALGGVTFGDSANPLAGYMTIIED